MSGDDLGHSVPGAFVGPATQLGLRPTGDYQPWPNGDGTQHFVNKRGRAVALLWQYGKVWFCRELDKEDNMPTQEEKDAARAALDIVWEKLEAIKQATWDAEAQFKAIKVALGLEGN
jgi:hypothetical protein